MINTKLYTQLYIHIQWNTTQQQITDIGNNINEGRGPPRDQSGN